MHNTKAGIHLHHLFSRRNSRDYLLNIFQAGTDAGLVAHSNNAQLGAFGKGLGGTFDFAAGEGSGEGLFDFTSWIMIDQKPMELGAWKQTDDYKAYAAKMGW